MKGAALTSYKTSGKRGSWDSEIERLTVWYAYLRFRINTTDQAAKYHLEAVVKYPTYSELSEYMTPFEYYVEKLSRCGQDVFIDKLKHVTQMRIALNKLRSSKNIATSKASYGGLSQHWEAYRVNIPTTYHEVRFLSLIQSGIVRLWKNWKFRLETWNFTVESAQLLEPVTVKGLSTSSPNPQRSYPKIPFIFPTAILFTFNLLEENLADLRLYPYFTTTLLIFANLEENSIKISWFVSKNHEYGFLYYQNPARQLATKVEIISFMNVPENAIKSLKVLIQYWKQLHTNFKMGTMNDETICTTIFLLRFKVGQQESLYRMRGDVCKISQEYFRFVNSTFYGNVLFFTTSRHLSRIAFNYNKFDYLAQILPYGQNQVEFYVQILFFIRDNFDTKLSKGCPVDQVVFWKLSVLLDQDVSEIKNTKLSLKIILILWLFVAVLLRESYNSSLYSLMAAKKEQNEFPKSIEEVLHNKEYDLILPNIFYDELYFLFSGDDSKVPRSLAKLYLKILKKSFVMQAGAVDEPV
ncbi:unnamed protein product [Orchesella dallaii]|uniref:Uncharacterized protein n=1 Tax=Orchesella dallaii TaxID=48710 RepID=A0ABP1SAX3_9HEXA